MILFWTMLALQRKNEEGRRVGGEEEVSGYEKGDRKVGKRKQMKSEKMRVK